MNAVTKKLLTMDKIKQSEREKAYIFHYENRQTVKAMPPEMLEAYKLASESSPTPSLDQFGQDTYTQNDWNVIMQEAITHRLTRPRLLNPWYTSEEGWQQFQQLWHKMEDAD